MKPKVILITGCSSGIGYDGALALAQRGHHVFAACRKESDVKKLKALGLEAVQMNMDDTHSIALAFYDIIKKTSGRLDIVINNAGYGQAGALEDVPRDALRSQFETNVFGLMDLTRLAIPVMRKQGHGRIINISSILGVVSMPFRGAYNASKYAVEGLSDTLRLELKPSGIQVITIEPGPIESRFRDNVINHSLKKINHEKSHFRDQYEVMLNGFQQQKNQSIFTRKTDVVISKLIHAIESNAPKTKYRVTFPAHLFVFLKRVLSVRMLDYMLSYLSKKELGQRPGERR
ncbi:oxidoreductase with NAD(P)-binding Rossmann-fold domain [Legionella lansingensis]|uniref:Oxidoreductase with NAD(P)-binding Rossmann-fold domain protein n=1 Tax=Legionella lansingensis TaxID=45067 RepID=A0A0W0VPJ0_9GAMM|nr:SDR family NAD(P)-dependent oxidoreductase [Legionella lansingensis]KTD22096.1 oxidoreductase with NAD(P)-binding Rossmann-fold domain protein [Legionella lansingensis]SNV45847.1 oxidoreductase with NAD(P)-binding Rossmann-fold domain [Legionella lansingensis]